MSVQGRRAVPNRGVGGRGGTGRPAGPSGERREGEEPPEPNRLERFVVGTETGVRGLVRLAAVLLWIPSGFVFWIPFLARRTVSYVLAVLYAGLTGGRTDGAERRWEQAVTFYQLGFRRILHAFRPEERRPDIGAADPPPGTGGLRRVVLEVAWAAVVWGAILWLVGLWPDAPAAVGSALAAGGEAVAAAAVAFDAWVRELLAR